MNTFMNALTNNEKFYTANDGTAYHTSGSPLVDLNFSVPALRQVAVNFYGKSKHDRYFYGAHRSMDAVMHCAYLLHPMMKTLCIP